MKKTLGLIFLAVAGVSGCATSNPPPQPAQTQTIVQQAERTPLPAPTRTVYIPPKVIVQQPPVVIPAPQGPQSGIDNYPINSEGSVINVRTNPSTVSGVVGQVVQDQYVPIDCTQSGDSVTGPWGTTTLWDHITSPYTGYVSDMWVNTASGHPVVGSC